MELKNGQLFDNRYRLVSILGVGASAQVWLAHDSMANNLKVAIKVLSAYKGIDTIGIQNFKREFTFVYNIQHQNLLTPTNYAICEGVPYLVLPYCDNGSSTSMVGRADENDVIKFLHDVSAGLECLHNHDIVHQDIKPDNILLDDDCNFLVTDFGISALSVNDPSSFSGCSGGTKPYLGPERFEKNAIPIKMNDIWALGATAYELITGNAPFGDHGGLLQAQGENLPDLPETIQPEVRNIILSCLDKEPWNRPSAETIRKKTQLYLETGSWKEKDGKKYLYFSVAAIAIILLFVGLGIWDYNRTKVFYYKDYVEYWGIPEGIGQLSGSEMQHRQATYRMEYSQHKLRRLSLVNPEGNLTSHNDTETMLTRFTDVRYYYTDDGKVDYKTIYDQAGKLLYKMDYDEALKTVTFRQNDEYGTEMNLRANTTDLQHQGQQLFEEKSHISRYLLTYDDKGLLTRLLYVGLQNVPAGDAENIYGISYIYDKRGHKTEEQFLGADGQPTSNGLGLSIKQYEFDADDNWCTARYLNIDRGPSHDGNNCALVKIESDEWGNRISEKYYTIDGEHSIRTDMGVSGFIYEYDENGHCVAQTCIGLENEPMICRYGYTKECFKYDENGYVSQISFLDADKNPISMLQEGNSWSRIEIINNTQGLQLERTYYDEEGNPSVNTHGYCKEIMAYDSLGNQTLLAYCDNKGEPVAYNGLYAKIAFENDEFGRVTAIRYLGTNGKPTLNEDGVSSTIAEYNRQGALVRMSYFDQNGKPVVGTCFFSSRTWDYDDLGNVKTWQFFDEKGQLTNNCDGVARCEFTYDSKTNFKISAKDYNNKGSLLFARYMAYDKRGNSIKDYIVTASGQLKPGTAVEHAEYDANNKPKKIWWTNLKDLPINKPGTKIASRNIKYDSRGNEIEQTYWDAAGKPSVNEQGAFKQEHKYNELGLVIYERNLDANGKPLTGANSNPEGKCEYDKQGNLIRLECYDGYGKPRLSSDGFFRMTKKYNKQGKPIEIAYYNVDGKMAKSRSNEYAKKTIDYNNKGMETRAIFCDEKQKIFRTDEFLYNEKNRLTEQRILNANKQLDDKFWGFSKLVISYNKSGLVPKQRVYYNKNGQKLGVQNYNSNTKQWGAMTLNNPQKGINIMGEQWKRVLMEISARCPMDVGNGVQIRNLGISNDVVSCIIRLMNINSEELTEEQLRNMRQAVNPIGVQLKKQLGIPSSVQFVLIVQDKNGKRI